MAKRKSKARRDKPVPVFVLLPLGNGYSREVFRGFVAYEPTRMKWDIVAGDDSGLDWLASQPNTGILTMCGDDHLLNARATVVNISEARGPLKMPTVIPDNRVAGRLAATHLLELGYEKFIFVGPPMYYAVQRFTGVNEVLSKVGLKCEYPLDIHPDKYTEFFDSLTPNFALISGSDVVARKMINMCRAKDIRVPGQVAVMGFDNDALFCECGTPTLTSVDTGGRKVGFEAARLMERLLAGGRPRKTPIRIPPAGIVMRESTAKRATNDQVLLRALDYVQDHALEGLTIQEVATGIGVCSKTLQKRYRHHFGGSIKDEIRRVQFQRAKQLLRDTDMKIIHIASSCGFNHAGRFGRAFRENVDMTPAEYRRRGKIGR